MSKDGNVLITGADGGIGRALAQEFASHGHGLILVVRDKEKASSLKTEFIDKYSVEVHVYQADLSKEGACEKLHASIKGDGLSVSYLVNNAGFAMHGPFSEADSKDLTDMQMVNMISLTSLVRLYLPEIINQGFGGVLNVASTAAFLPGPYMSAYYATKHFVLNLSVAVNEELSGSDVWVSALCPGPTKSGFQKRSGTQKLSFMSAHNLMSAEKVASVAYKGFMARKAIIIPGFRNKMTAFGPRLARYTTLARSVARFQR